MALAPLIESSEKFLQIEVRTVYYVFTTYWRCDSFIYLFPNIRMSTNK